MTTPGEERPPVVLVTGASGSIGAATVACLRDRGCEVVTADRTALPADVAGRGATGAQATSRAIERGFARDIARMRTSGSVSRGTT